MHTIWLQNPLAVYTANNDDARGGVVVEGDRIVELVAGGQRPARSVDKIFDASAHVLIPGLVNCHHHFYQTLTRAFPDALNKELFDWLVNLYPLWAHLDREAVAVSSELAMVELMLSGCTTISDHHYLFNDQINDAIDIQVEQAQRLGVRVVLTRGSMSLGKDQGGLPPNSVVQSHQQILDESARLLSTYHQQGPGAMVQIALAPCSPFSVTRDLMIDSATLAREHGALLHTHLAETLDENDFCLQQFGLRPVDYLESVGWLQDDVWLAHGIHFNDEEIQRLGQAGIAISHCPSSNMMLASGSSPVLQLEAAGSAVGLGVDGSASNDCSNMIEECRQAFLLQRLQYGSARVSHLDALRWGTQGGANLFKRSDIGEIAVGKQADLALFKLDELRFSGSHDPLAALILCGAKKVDYLMVAGQFKVEKGELAGVDLQQLITRHSLAAHKMVCRYREP